MQSRGVPGHAEAASASWLELRLEARARACLRHSLAQDHRLHLYAGLYRTLSTIRSCCRVNNRMHGLPGRRVNSSCWGAHRLQKCLALGRRAVQTRIDDSMGATYRDFAVFKSSLIP